MSTPRVRPTATASGGSEQPASPSANPAKSRLRRRSEEGGREDEDGRIAILLWNLTLDQTKAAGEPALTRRVALTLAGLDGDWSLRQTLLNAGSGDITSAVSALGIKDWPNDEAQWDELAEATRLHTTETSVSADGELSVEVTLDMPSAVLLELSQAILVRRCFPDAPLKYMPPTKHKETDIFFSHAYDVMADLVVALDPAADCQRRARSS